MADPKQDVADMARTLSDASPAVWASKQIARVGEAAQAAGQSLASGLTTAKRAVTQALTPTPTRGDIELKKDPPRRRSLSKR